LLELASGRATACAAVFDHVQIVTADQSHALGLQVLVGEALEHEGRSWSGEQPCAAETSVGLAEIRGLIDMPRSRLLVAMQGEVIVGCVLVTCLPGGRSALGLLGVDPRFRRRGLGARLIAAAEMAAEHHFGADQIELCVLAERHALSAYYRRFGFACTGEHRSVPLTKATMQFQVMAKPLPRAIAA
jgi:ribosomal protein S18 acetylase RimI-like enzyme